MKTVKGFMSFRDDHKKKPPTVAETRARQEGLIMSLIDALALSIRSSPTAHQRAMREGLTRLRTKYSKAPPQGKLSILTHRAKTDVLDYLCYVINETSPPKQGSSSSSSSK